MGIRISGRGRRVFPRPSWPCVSRPSTHRRLYNLRGGPTGWGWVAGTHKAMTERAGHDGARIRLKPAPPEGSEVESVGMIVPVSGDGRVRPGHDKGHRSVVRPAGMIPIGVAAAGPPVAARAVLAWLEQWKRSGTSFRRADACVRTTRSPAIWSGRRQSAWRTTETKTARV